jgi:TrmH family RNA methyltransferase
VPAQPKLSNLCVVLVATRNPLNIGAAARAMSNFGFSQLRVVHPYELAFREARSAVGASKLLADAKEFQSVADAVADCTLVIGTTAVGRRTLQHPLRRLEPGARIIRSELLSTGVALLFGSEKVGLSNEDLSHCHWLLRIPTREEHRSLNLGQAVAICLYELIRDSKPPHQPKKEKRAAARDLERITEVLLEALRASGYLDPRPSAIADEKVRRLIRRLNLSAKDAAIFPGMLRQIVWNLQPR